MVPIQNLRGEYDGERIFLIGNGPSLQETPLKLLENEYTIGMNKINKIYSETSWRPSFYFNGWLPEYIEANKNSRKDTYIQDNIDLGIPVFLSEESKTIFGKQNNIYYCNIHRLKTDGNNKVHDRDLSEVADMAVEEFYPFWSDSVHDVLYEYNAMYAVAQLAVYMGFDELYFVGCDLGFEYQNPHMVFEQGLDPFRHPEHETKLDFIRKAINRDVLVKSFVNWLALKAIYLDNMYVNQLLMNIIEDSDTDHFTSDYMIRVVDRTIHGREIKKSHRIIKEICDERGIGVYNATIGGELETYERVNIEDIIQ